MLGYRDLIAASREEAAPAGLTAVPALHPALKPHQAHCVDFALRQGRAALFLDTGLGKTLASLDWARIVSEKTGLPVLMLAPLGVVQQHAREAARFGIDARVARQQGDIGPGINIANYDRLHLFDAAAFGGVVLDESSIIKSFTGTMTRRLMAFASGMRFRLACTATPAPNDHMELGQHAQFLGVMSSSEMLTRWFIADQRNMGRYRLKRAAINSFWSWVASWARCISTPSDLGFADDGYVLPALTRHKHVVVTDWSEDAGEDDGQFRLLRLPDNSATAIHREKRRSADARAAVMARLVAAEPAEPWIVWCDTDYEADALRAVMPAASEVRGCHKAEAKEEALLAFADGEIRTLITKPGIAGYGLNWQHCARVGFAGLSFSYEAYYQAVRRCWRFGQQRPVDVHVACADTEEAIWQSIQRKSGDHSQMKDAMRAAMRSAAEVRSTRHDYPFGRPIVLPSFMEAA